MLIFPVEQKPDWRRPPLVTLFLILANCLIFIFYQLPDDGRTEKALQAYKDSGLYTQEQDIYLRHIRFDPWKRAALMEARDDGNNETVMVHLLHDLSFDESLREREGFASSEWETKRLEVEGLRNQISYIRFGYKPSDPSIIDAFVSTFLHGGFGHLFGNMLFLFIFGFGLEASLGRKAYLGVYLTTGYTAVGLYQLAEWNSFSFGVGASGAIAGLMGAYLAVYGLKRIRFFTTLGFYFNTITAPAVVVFPFWLGKEILNGLFGTEGINYWAHAGGLAGGFAIVWWLKSRGLKIAETALTDEEQIVTETPYQRERRILEGYMSDLQLFKAIELCQRLMQKYPGDKYLLNVAWNLFEGLPDHAMYEQVVTSILELPPNEGDKATIARVYGSYRKTTGRMPADDEVSLSLLERFLDSQWKEYCVELTEHLVSQHCSDERFQSVVETMARRLRNKDIDKSKQLKAYGQQTFPQAETA
ncbi:rhomboid family intramembrane serine protease [Parendozoicomonas sp. Alg238-R29]|uniref:rhomboid family intramembrane serine protease n=1 Tax=Parendozoicomonas sp. Alg238-R29 TaxID=2993446 RepID=UPI00248E5EC5|nr:rhomboid family intramembrane serine protease [Parendozoicomonas sp. Alg238-R29]